MVHDEPPRFTQQRPRAVQRGTDRGAAVPGRRLHVQIGDGRLAQDAAVRDAVQGDAAGHAQRGRAGFRLRRAREAEHNLLGDRLNAGRDVGVMLIFRFQRGVIRRPLAEVGGETRCGREERGFGPARSAEQIDEPIGERA